jgi:large subunit ribosomal protein L6
MSRIGRKIIELPKGVTVTLANGVVKVKGPKGELQKPLNARVDVKIEGNTVEFSRRDEARESRAAHGLMRALTANMVTGVSEGFERKLEINGVGYRAEVKGKQIVMALGFSHPIEYDLPAGVTAKVDKNVLTLAAIDKEVLGQTAAKVRSFRPPEPYKGKGVKYLEETIQRKVGKAGAG